MGRDDSGLGLAAAEYQRRRTSEVPQSSLSQLRPTSAGYRGGGVVGYLPGRGGSELTETKIFLISGTSAIIYLSLSVF